MTDLATLLHDDDETRALALEAISAAPEHVRSAMASKLAPVAREAAAVFGTSAEIPAATLGRACAALALLRVELAKHCLFRIADEGSHAVKATLAQALRGTATTEGRSVLVHLLSDDDAFLDAISAIGVSPWPAVLPALIEVAEADRAAAELAVLPIARCGELGGPAEAAAALDFLLEQLDDDQVAPAAAAVVFPLCLKIPGFVRTALARLARSGRLDRDAARRILGPLLEHGDERVRTAAVQTARAIDTK